LTAPLSVAIRLPSGRGTPEGFDGLRRVEQGTILRATWKDEIPQERGAKDADNRAERYAERNH
jgi:hypothetical protein